MKKKTVITTEKLEVWFITQSSDIPEGGTQTSETDRLESEPSSESLTPVPEEHPDKNVPPNQEN